MKRNLLLLGAIALAVALMAAFVTDSFVPAKAALASAHPQEAFAKLYNTKSAGDAPDCSQKTQLLLKRSGLAVSSSTIVTPHTIQISCYETINILVHNTGTTNSVTLTFNIIEGSTSIPLDIVSGAAGAVFSKSYQAPGRNLSITASSTPGTTIDILVFGHV
ncbi:MAG: hypothetical protein JOZ18_13080 [Chloroflexi bacterium]|nr:hypothetical protein [Chloroflexota bacterium]